MEERPCAGAPGVVCIKDIRGEPEVSETDSEALSEAPRSALHQRPTGTFEVRSAPTTNDKMTQHFPLLTFAFAFAHNAVAPLPSGAPFETLVFGGSAGGVAAAIAASANGTRAVALVEPLDFCGGMLSAGGLGLCDQIDHFHTQWLASGLAREWLNRVSDAYGVPRSDEVLVPDMHVSQAVVDAMLADRPSITVMTGCSLVSAARGAGAALASITVDCGPGGVRTLAASVFIDGSPAGDLLVASGVSYSAGREAASTYNEPLAGVFPGDGECVIHNISGVDAAGAPLPYVSRGVLPPWGAADESLMGFGHRACVSSDADRVPFPAPTGYDRTLFTLLQRRLDAAHSPLPLSAFVDLIPYSRQGRNATRRKFMLCCGSGGVDADAITVNAGYVGAFTARAREAADAAHTLYLLGSLHYLATDSAVPAATRADAARYGLCADEWSSTGHWPPQLYVREGARLVNDAVLTQHSLAAPRGKEDGVAVGAWYLDKHVVRRVVGAGGLALNEGHFRASTEAPGAFCNVAPGPCANATAQWYDVPYAALTPRRAECVNLLLPVPLAASCVAYSSTRIESMFMGTGAAAGVAARLAAAAAAAKGGPAVVQDVDVRELQRVLVDELHAVIHGPPVGNV